MNKLSNSIIIGGPIAVGKSTLVGALPFIPVQELESNDELQRLLLEQMYVGDIIASQIFQLDMLLTRFDKFEKLANNEKMHVFDRSIFEDIFFAKALLSDYENIWEYYYSIWKDKVATLKSTIGLPKMYILLTCSWETFRERVFERDRSAETDNFTKNEAYFKNMINTYEDFMVSLFEEHDINYKIVNTDNLNKIEVINKAKDVLKEEGIL